MLKKLILGSALLCSAAAQADVWKMVLAEGTGNKWSFKQNSLCAPAGDFGRESGFLHFEVKKGGVYRFAVEYAKEKGCYDITLNVWSLNERAIAFYQKMGLKPLKVYMEEII